MPKEFLFFAYLLESYSQSRGLQASDVLKSLEDRNKADFVYDMYEMYHSEAVGPVP